MEFYPNTKAKKKNADFNKKTQNMRAFSGNPLFSNQWAER